ncbi:MAG: T9SS-dependent M36 family metallopeptidase [Chryseobacterium sp.]|jgi:hypothetical protein|uniref:T9SS-dependent M36 family metallopeptidase n=1 Tax=Chryseobacterium sp. TaxID=1871047 RepID=UPI002838BCFF|nr:T9SS-dependent M36 family metallopeptidase [Chryseobacterium sp.]MDR2236143.1 T9SS-dependent M36 family metallopeptidase [Chryseobacterium sp.]
MNKKVFLVPVSVAFLLAFGTISAQNSTRLIQDYYQKKGEFTQKNNGNKKADVRILNEDVSKSLGVTIVNVQQTYDGRRVYNALGKVIIKDEKIIFEKNEFSRNIVTAVQKKAQEKFSEDFLKQKLELKAIRKINYLPDVYFEKNGIYILSKEIFVSDRNSSAVWHVIAAADSGEILSKNNTTLSCNFDHPSDDDKFSIEELTSYSEITEHCEAKTNTVNKKAHLLQPDNASYNVFALPLEAPTFGSRSLVTNPWDLTTSPEGWHSDGTNHYTNTRGNNVYAYSDQDGRNTPGYSPDGGNSRNFDFPFADGSNDSPFTYRDAGITNLFYMNNKMHDIFYRFGFTESARNFQTNNFDRGGIGGDAVNAEAFDGSDLGNANFSPGHEYIQNGVPNVEAPRMQMYLFPRKATATDPNPVSKYHYNAPPDVVNRPKVSTFSTSSPYNISTGDLAIPTSDNSCTAMAAGSLSGRIALIKDEGCEYGLKILNAQNAGATGAIIYSPTYTSPISIDWGNFGNYTNQITIPSLDMGKTEGEFLVGQINSGTVINATLGLDNTTGFKHSSLDNGVVAHEYGHGISNRLTAKGYECLNPNISNEQMGEGWSDYFALMLTARPGDNAALARGMGTYVMIESTNGPGIRLARYSPDFSVNNYTYGRTNSNNVSIPHGMGFVWATMLWDLTWQYIERYGYNSDVLASTTSGNARALQIVMDALKLQDCNPTFIDGRDAIIRADSLGNAGADRCMIWNTFARRGLGLNASAGNKAVRNDQVEDFTVPADCALATHETNTANTKYIVFPNPTYDEFFVGNIDKSSQEVKIKMFDMSGKLVFSDTRESTSRKAISTKGLQKGVYMVNIQQGDKMQTEKLIVR